MEREKNSVEKRFKKKKSFLKERPQKSSDSQVLISKSFSLDPWETQQLLLLLINKQQ